MSYYKHTWEDGEVITQNRLNNIEDGIEESHIIVAKPWNAEESYNNGMYCTSRGKLWKCITPYLVIFGGEPPSEGDTWTQVTTMDEVRRANIEINKAKRIVAIGEAEKTSDTKLLVEVGDEEVELAEMRDVKNIADITNWNKIECDITCTSLSTWTEQTFSELLNAKAVVVCIGDNITIPAMYRISENTQYSIPRIWNMSSSWGTPSGFLEGYDCRWNPVTGAVGIRQLYKGTSSAVPWAKITKIFWI